MQSTQACSGVAQRKGGVNDTTMQESEKCSVRELWWKGNRVQVRFCDFLRSLDSRELGLLAEAQGNGIRSDRQQWTLRAGEYPMGKEEFKPKQSSGHKMVSCDASIQIGTPRGKIWGLSITKIIKFGFEHVRNYFSLSKKIIREEEVWDIADCGSRNSFTCEGLLVHNSGNFLRFRDQWDALYGGGVDKLDDGVKKSKPEPTDKEKERAKCPACGALWPGNADICAHCGMVRLRKNDVVSVAGELLELTGQTAKKEKFSMEVKTDFYARSLGYAAEKGYKPGWACFNYEKKFGVKPAMKKPAPLPPDAAFRGWIQHLAMKKRSRK